VPTALSSTEPAATEPITTGVVTTGLVASARRAVADVAILFSFRAQTVRRRRLARGVGIAVGLLTLAIAVVPAFTPGAGGPDRAFDLFLLMPSAMAGLLLLNVSSAVASGGGRELISRDQASPYPISPTTDHLGALVLAPLNIAWMIQAWALLGTMAYSFGPHRLFQAQVVMVLWLVMSTAVGQVVAWTMEAVRRGPAGILVTRGLLVAIGLAVVWLQLTHRTTHVLDRIPTLWVFAGGVSGWSLRWGMATALVAAIAVAAVALGALPAHLAARRTPRDETRMETDQHQARPAPRTILGALVRVDRASVWRAVPMRRGLMVLAVGPGLVAIVGNLEWHSMTILPGLVASGGALLFGVNAWCLDGRGALWRENLPIPATAIFDARALVLAEFLGAASLITVLLAGLRAGMPSPAEFSALFCTVIVVLLQVVGAALRWSIAHPFPVDLRSARATPAPPASMVGYSARLALCTTVTSLVFSGLAQVPDWRLSALFAIPCLVWSGNRLARTRSRWQDPVARARVVATVAA
jgi:hypothetical protein